MSFSGAIASITRFSSMWPGSGSWTSSPSTESSALSSRDRLEQLRLARVGGQLDVARLHAGRLRGPLLQVDVDVRCGVVADEHRGEADVPELRDLRGDLLAHLRAERLAVEEGRGHARQVSPRE